MELNRQLDGIRRSSRNLLLLRGSGLIGVSVLSILAVLVVIDWYIRFDMLFRFVLFLLFASSVVWMFVTCLVPMIRFRPTRMDVALRIERIHSSTEGRIASASQFLDGDTGHPGIASSIEDAESVLASISDDRILRPRGAIVWSLGGLAVVVTIVVLTITSPSTTGTALSRILLPASDAAWPARTSVSSLMDGSDGLVHGRGTTLLMRASNDTQGSPDDPVWVEYRSIGSGGSDQWSSVLMTHQSDSIHERTIEPSGDSFEYRFRTEDASTDSTSIRLVDMPRIVDAEMRIVPPDYVGGSGNQIVTRLVDGTVPVNRVSDPVLVGSRVELEIVSNNDLSIPEDGPSRAAWLDDILITSTTPPPTLVHDPGSPERFTLSWTMTDPVRQVMQIRDVHGLQTLDPWDLWIKSIDDARPVVAFELPSNDMSVLPEADIEVRLSGSDDIRLDRLRVVAERSVPAEATDSSASTWRRESIIGVGTGSIEDTIALSDFDFEPGTTIILEGMAWDSHRSPDGLDRATTAQPRRIQIIDESRFLSMIRNKFKILQQRAKELDARQDQLQRVVRSGTWTTSDQREQAAIGRALQEQSDQLESIEDEMEMNRSDNQQIEALLTFSDDTIDRAVAASDSATDLLRDEEQDRETLLDRQEEVRFELGELVSMLGEDEEAWIISRQVDQLIEQQAAIQERTSSLGQDLIGLTPEDMDAEQDSAIEGISREQLALTEEARDLVESLEERMESMKDIAPNQSEAMQSAMEKVEDEEVVDRMREASEQVSQGLMQSATRSQQQVLDSLNQVRSMLEESNAVDVEELVRNLEALRDSIERLVRMQRRELERLGNAIQSGSFVGRDTPMIRLRTNSLSVSKQARESGDETRGVSRTLDRAAGEQAGAIRILRSSTIDGAAVRGHEERSLQLLETALEDTTSEMDQAREEMQNGERGELAALYRSIGEREVSLVEQTSPLITLDKLDRRSRFEARRISREQEEIRISILKIGDDNEELLESSTFRHMHDRLDSLSRSITSDLKDGVANRMVQRRQEIMVRELFALAESIEQESDEDRFADGQQSGSGGASGGSSPPQQGLIPPISEIKLLRSMQVSLLEETRSMEIDPDQYGESRSFVMNDLAGQQDALVELGLEMMEKLKEQEQARNDQDFQPDESDVVPIPVPRFHLSSEESPSGSTMDSLPDLDELLGIESEDDPEHFEPVVIPGEPLEGLEPLTEAITSMHEAARRLEIDSTGVQTQRLQQDVIYQLDQLLQMAQDQEQQQQSSSSSSQSQPEPGSQQQSGQPGQPEQQASADSGDSGDQPSVMDASDPNLGGSIDEMDSEWGTLPDRVRKMLQQGRQDSYSSLYERMTIEYYRRLAREARDE